MGLTKIPTSRDPFALMRTVPEVLVDRVNANTALAQNLSPRIARVGLTVGF